MRSKWYRAGAVILFLLVLALTACHVQQRTDTRSDQISGRKYRVALVAKSAESAFWKSVRAGANAASTEYNLDFVFQAPLSEEDYEAQNNMIESAVEDALREKRRSTAEIPS